jgi:hypothetical protein
MTDPNDSFCRAFFRSLRDEPIEPSDPRYENFYESPEFSSEDPVRHVAFEIENSRSESTQLLSGYRGTGKSTELRRLAQYLSKRDYFVVLVPMLEHYNMTSPIDVTDFLLTVAGAFGDGLADPSTGILKDNPRHQSYFERFQSFLGSLSLDFGALDIKTGIPPASFAAQLKFNLRGNPAFKAKLQHFLQGAVGTLVEHVHEYFHDRLALVAQAIGPDVPVVLLVDDLEKMRGETSAAESVQQSVAALFSTHGERLRIPGLHVLYTAPLYLRVREPGVGNVYGNGFHVLPAIRLREKLSRSPVPVAFDVIERIVRRRGDWQRLLGSRDVLDEVIAYSGGHFRDLLSLLREIAKRGTFTKDRHGTTPLPVPSEVVRAAVYQVQSEYLPIPDDDILWLEDIRVSNEHNIRTMTDVPRFSRLLDNHLAVGYRDGLEWYDVHPLIYPFVERRATELRQEGRRHGIPLGKPPRES